MNFECQPFLKNKLVEIRPLEVSDFEKLYEIASDALIWEQHQNKDRHTKENFIRFFNESIESKGAVVIIDTATEKIIGSSRFKIIDAAEGGVVEIGWSFLSRAYWGGIYNREFKKLIVDHALRSFKSVIFYVNPKNLRSQKALEKLGARKMKYPDNTWVLPEDIGFTYMVNSKLE